MQYLFCGDNVLYVWYMWLSYSLSDRLLIGVPLDNTSCPISHFLFAIQEETGAGKSFRGFHS